MGNNSYGWAAPSYNTGGKGGNGDLAFQPYFGPGGYNTQTGQLTDPRVGQQAPAGYGGYDYAYGMPGAPFASGGSPGASNPFMNAMTGDPNLRAPGNYASENWRNMMEGYTNYGFTPFVNADIAYQTLGMNRDFGGWDRNEQQRLNNLNYSLARAGAQREDAALNFGMQTNQRDFGETQRQFDRTAGQTDYANQSQRLGIENQYKLGDYANRTGRIDVEGRLANDQFGNETDRMNVQNQYKLGQGALENQGFANQTGRMDVQNQYRLGQESNANTRFGLENQYKLGQGQLSNDQFSNQTQRLGVENQFSLGNRGLDLQGREIDTNAQIARERMRSDEMNNRYQVFGRSQAPNTKAMRSWY